MVNTSLLKKFNSLSTRIWNDMRDGYKHGISMGEESITDYLLLNASRFQNVNIEVYQFSKMQESKNGADWQWWFLSPGKRNAFGIRIQAKKLNIDSQSYKYLDDHKIDKTNKAKKIYQVDLLINDANRHPKFKLYPLYFFYNYWDDRTITKKLVDCCKDAPHGSNGWTFAKAPDIRPLAISGKKSLDPDVVRVSHPIKCLFCYDESKFDLPRGVQSALQKIASEAEIPPVYKGLPEHIQRLVNDPSSLSDFAYSEYFRDVDGVALFTQSE